MIDNERIDHLEDLAVRVQTEDSTRELDVELVLALRPDTYFNAGPSYQNSPDKIGIHGFLGDLIPDDNEPLRFVPLLTSSWDAAKKFMLPNWTIYDFHEWFGHGCTITLTEGEIGPTGTWYHTDKHLKIEQQGPRDVGVLLAAIILSYAYCLRYGKELG